MQKQVYEFISTKTSDPIVERKTCKVSGQSFAIFQSDVEMLDKLSPVIGGQKIALPLPTLCPEERNTRRISFRNDSKIYRRTCDFTGKPFISMYSPEKPYKVYHNDIWYSDKRDAIQFGRDFDFTQDFFPQFTGLLLEVPRLGLQVRNSENCDYCGVASHAKNCYLSNVCSWSEDVHYSSWVTHSKSCMDCFRCYKIENSYQCIFCNSSLKLNYCILVNNSFDCLRSINLDNCENCFLCHNLNNKKYCIRNTQYTKEEYMEYIRKIDRCDAHWFQTTEAEFTKMRQEKTIYRATCNTNTPDSYGAFLTDSKNCKICFDIVTGEDCSYFFDAGSDEKSCMDCSYGGDIEKSYESLSSGTK